MRVFFNWMIEKNYVLKNLFEVIKTKKKEPQRRILIDKLHRDKIISYLEVKNKNYIPILKLVYSAFLRPVWWMKIRGF